MALLPVAGSIKVAESTQGLSPPVTSHWSTSHGQPGTGQPVTSQDFTGHPVTSQPITGQDFTSHPLTGQPVTGQPVTSQPGTGQPVTSQMLPGISRRSLDIDYQAPGTSHQAFNHQSSITGHPVTGHWSTQFIKHQLVVIISWVVNAD